MKKLLVATLLLAGVSMTLFSCNNGAYDADPKTDLSKGKNPLDPNSGVSVYLGTIEGSVNKKKILMNNAKYQVDTLGIRHIVAYAVDDAPVHRRMHIALIEEKFEQAKVYNIGADAFAWTFTFAVRDTTRTDRILEHLYIANTATGKGNIEFNVKGVEDGNMRGTFKGTVYRSILSEDGVTPSGEFDMEDSVSFQNMEFYIPKGKIW